MDLELFKEIGLSEGEIKVYVALFKLGSTSTGALIKEARVHASKVYHILDRLIEKGLVSYVKEGKKTIYTANPANSILAYLDKQQNKIVQQKQSAERLISDLELLKKLGKKETETTIFRGIKGLKNAYQIAMSELEEGEEGYAMFLPSVNKDLALFFQNCIQSLSKKKINHYLLYHEPSPEIKLVKHLPGVKIKISAPQGYKSPAEMCVYGRYTIISTSGGDEYITILIKDEIISNSFRNQFRTLWKRS